MKRKTGRLGAVLSFFTLSIGYFYWGWRCGVSATLALLLGSIGIAFLLVRTPGPISAIFMQLLPLLAVALMVLYHSVLSSKSTLLIETQEEAKQGSGVEWAVSSAQDVQVLIQKAYAWRLAVIVFMDLMFCFLGLSLVALLLSMSIGAYQAGLALAGTLWLALMAASVAGLIVTSRFITERIRSSFSLKLYDTYETYATTIQTQRDA